MKKEVKKAKQTQAQKEAKEKKEQIQEPREWKIRYYRNDEGECPIEEFMETLLEKDRVKLKARLDMLTEQGIELKRPHADYLRDGIHELRVKLSQGQTRTLYFFCYKDYIVLTHAFYKRERAVPDIEIYRSLLYKHEILQKYNETNIEEL
jgi:phage-related protein